jgi:hypothetical protein
LRQVVVLKEDDIPCFIAEQKVQLEYIKYLLRVKCGVNMSYCITNPKKNEIQFVGLGLVNDQADMIRNAAKLDVNPSVVSLVPKGKQNLERNCDQKKSFIRQHMNAIYRNYKSKEFYANQKTTLGFGEFQRIMKISFPYKNYLKGSENVRLF